MAWEPVKNLFKIIPLLRSSQYTNDSKAQSIALLLENMELLYVAFKFDPKSDSTRTLEVRVKDWEKAVGWFQQELPNDSCNKYGITLAVSEMLQTTTLWLRALNERNKKINIIPNNICWLSTLIVENFFGTIRSHTLYPSLDDYAIIHDAAWRELVKRLIADFPVPQFKANIGKAYAVVEGLCFNMTDLPLYNSVQKARQLKNVRENNKSIDKEQQIHCINM